MKDVKKNMKVISKNVTKEFMIDFAIATGKNIIVNEAIKYVPNPTAQTAVRVAGFVGYLWVANRFTKEESANIDAALYDMFFGKKPEDLTDEMMEELNKKLIEEAAKAKFEEGKDA